jgi:hypothetical protein
MPVAFKNYLYCTPGEFLGFKRGFDSGAWHFRQVKLKDYAE